MQTRFSNQEIHATKHFVRKLTASAASALVGASLLFGAVTVANADSNVASDNQATDTYSLPVPNTDDSVEGSTAPQAVSQNVTRTVNITNAAGQSTSVQQQGTLTGEEQVDVHTGAVVEGYVNPVKWENVTSPVAVTPQTTTKAAAVKATATANAKPAAQSSVVAQSTEVATKPVSTNVAPKPFATSAVSVLHQQQAGLTTEVGNSPVAHHSAPAETDQRTTQSQSHVAAASLGLVSVLAVLGSLYAGKKLY